MRSLFSHAASAALLLVGLNLGAGCGQPGVDDVASESAALDTVAPNPPPTSCDSRYTGVTGIQAVVRIDQYQGLITGKNGVHEIAYGTITSTPWVYDSHLVDTSNVELALNVKSKTDPSGLPHEIKLAVGSSIEVEGEYIPASSAGAHDKHGAAAVIHYTHAPCGYASINGTVYK